MDRRLLLVFALTFLVIMLFQPVLKKYLPQPPAKPESSQAVPLPNQAQPPTPAGATNAAPTASSGKNTPAAAPQQASSESETVIENGLYRIVFTNRGGRVKSWVLKNYKDRPNGNPLDLVNTEAAKKYGYPLSLWTYDEGLRNQLNSALYVATSTSAQAPAEITFLYADGDVSARKSY
ncbi:MAG TPA: membrane protein insertase YidC, partial [Terriglobales bacterium]